MVATAVQSQYVTVSHGKTRYIEAGSGHPVILLHSSGLQSGANAGWRVRMRRDGHSQSMCLIDDGIEFLSILTAIRNLPGRKVQEPAERAERDREKEVIKRRLAALTNGCPRVLDHIQRAVAALNGVRGTPRSFDGLDELLSAQPYRLAYWRVAAEENRPQEKHPTQRSNRAVRWA